MPTLSQTPLEQLAQDFLANPHLVYHMIFQDRHDAGIKLIKLINGIDLCIAIPRGGIPVAAPICKHFQCNMLLSFPRKLSAPNNDEFAIGSINAHGDIYLNDTVCKQLKITDNYIEKTKKAQLHEIQKRRAQYPTPDIAISGKNVAIIDDGLATGLTMLAAVNEIQHHQPASVCIIVPVAPQSAISSLSMHSDIICLHIADNFRCVGQFYKNFNQVSATEANKILQSINKG